MRKLVIASAVASAFAFPAAVAIAADAPAAAPASPHTFTGNVSLASEYLYRGIAQTRGKLALQGGFDYSHASGFYLGTWGSNISWLSDGATGVTAPLELDVYGGYKNTFGGGDWNYDVGVLTYNYPGSYPAGFVKPDTTEVYGAIGYKWLSLKVSDVVSSHIFGVVTPTGGDTRGSTYVDLTGTFDLGGGWGVTAHAGHQKVKDYGDASYTDYRLGVTKDLGFGVLGLTLSSTNAKDSCSTAAGTGSFDATNPYCLVNTAGGTYEGGKSRAVLSFSKSL